MSSGFLVFYRRFLGLDIFHHICFVKHSYTYQAVNNPATGAHTAENRADQINTKNPTRPHLIQPRLRSAPVMIPTTFK